MTTLCDILSERAREHPDDRAYVFLSDRGEETDALTFAVDVPVTVSKNAVKPLDVMLSALGVDASPRQTTPEVQSVVTSIPGGALPEARGALVAMVIELPLTLRTVTDSPESCTGPSLVRIPAKFNPALLFGP